MAELTDEEVFGKQSQLMSDDDVFGTQSPGLFGYAKEGAKELAIGAMEGPASAMRGLGAQMGTRGDGGAEERAIDRIMRGEDIDTAVSQGMANPVPARPVTEEPFYQVGEAISKGTEEALAPQNVFHPLGRDVLRGFGSVVGNIGTAIIPGVGPAATALSLPAQGAGEAAQTAVKRGATPEQQRQAATLGNIAGATDLVDVALPLLGSTGRVAGLIGKVGARVLYGALAEGGQEGLQQFIQNAIAKGVYKPDQDLKEDVAYSALVGAIVGGGASGILGRSDRDGGPTTPNESAINVFSRDDDGGGSGPATMVPIEVASSEPGAPATTGTLAPTPITTNVGVAPVAAPAPPGVKPATPLDDVTSALGPEPPPHLEVPPTALSMPGDVVDFIAKKAAPFDATPNTSEPLFQEIKSRPGANTGRLARLLGPKLYGEPKEMATVSVKEMMQNSFDAIKGMLEKGLMKDGNIDISFDNDQRLITVQDDGSGMSPEVLGRQFLEIAGTHKESERASGGLGIAKMLFLFGNKALGVTTLRDGKISTLVTTGSQLFSALEDPSSAPNISVRDATPNDLKMFPKGHGTRVAVSVPTDYKDSSSGETVPIEFKTNTYYHNVLRFSPLFGDINVRVNGEPVTDMGTTFPIDKYTSLFNVNFKWGSARIYVSKEKMEGYSGNAHVLSNGLWQFSFKIKEDPNDTWSSPLPYRFYIDVNPKVKPEDAGYPFDLNRQQFAKQANDDFSKVLNYVSLMYKQESHENSAGNFGDVEYVSIKPGTKDLKISKRIKIEPKAPPPDTALKRLKKGDKVTVVDGKMVVNGRAVPELTKEEIEKFKINSDSLTVPQESIDATQVMVHDNVDVKISDLETKSIVQLGREKFGKRFDEFNYLIGKAFMTLRDTVAELKLTGEPT